MTAIDIRRQPAGYWLNSQRRAGRPPPAPPASRQAAFLRDEAASEAAAAAEPFSPLTPLSPLAATQRHSQLINTAGQPGLYSQKKDITG